MHLNDLLFLLPKISFFPNLHPEMFPEYVFERGFTNSASFFTEKRGASFSQFPLCMHLNKSVEHVFIINHKLCPPKGKATVRLL